MIFLDSSFLISYALAADTNHSAALKVMERDVLRDKYGTSVISDYIFDECVTVVLARTKDVRKAVLMGENLLKSLKILKIDEALFEKAWQLFKEQGTTKLSFTDCTTIALCASKEIRNIATFDREYSAFKEIEVVS